MADTQIKNADEAKSMIPSFFANYVPAAGMATGGVPAMMSPEMMHEANHAKMMGVAPQQPTPATSPVASDMSATQAPLAGMDPNDPLAAATNASALAANTGGVGVPQQGDDLRSFLQGQVGDATGAENAAQAGLESSVQQQGAGLDVQTEGQQRELAASAAEKQAEQPLLQEHTRIAQEFEKQQRDIQAAGQRAFDAQMTRVRSAIAEANTVEVKNFWSDASTGAKIMGVIAQALSGAANGLAGNPSAVTPLDRIIEQDMQRQEYNAQQKNKAAYREQGVLNLIQKQTGDRLAAANGMRVAAWERVSSQIAEMKNTMGGPVADAQAQALDGLATQRKGMFNEKMQGILLQKAQTDKAQALRAIGTLDATQAVLQKQKNAALQNKFSVIGVEDDGTMNKTQYEKAAPMSEAYAKYLTALQGMKGIASQGLSSNPIAQKKLYDQYSGQAFAAIRVMDNTGAALGKNEEGYVLPRVPSFSEVMMPGYSSMTGGAKLLDTSLDSVTDGYFGGLQALGIKSRVNPNDPIAGEAAMRYVQRRAGQGQ